MTGDAQRARSAGGADGASEASDAGARGAALAAAIAVGVVALAAWVLWRRYHYLAASPYPLGVDGYFYPIQLRALLADGALHYPQAPLAFWLMAPLAALTDPITGAKLGAAAAGAALVIPMYLVGARVGGSRAAGALAAAIVATSAGSFYLGTEFVKNSFGLALAVGFWAALAWALDAPRRRIALALALAAACVATHKMAAAVAVAGAIAPIAVWWRGRVRQPDRSIARSIARSIDSLGVDGRRAWWRAPITVAVGVALAAFAIVLALGAAWPDRFLSPGDVALLGDVFGGPIDWSLPALSVRGYTLTFDREPAIAAILGALCLALWARSRWSRGRSVRRPDTASDPADARGSDPADARGSIARAFAFAPAALALLAGIPSLSVADAQGLGFRLRVIAFVPLAVCAAFVAGQILAGAASRGHRRAGVAAIWAIAALLLLRPALADPDEGVVRVHPAMQAAVRAVDGLVPPGDVVIVPERHIAFMVVWYTDADARLRPEPVPAARRWRLLPRARIHPALDAALDRARAHAAATGAIAPPRGLHPTHANGLVLIPEATWQWLMAELPPDVRAHYQRWPTL